jgi:hypothetical protein
VTEAVTEAITEEMPEEILGFVGSQASAFG